jgi:hypothetical protein
MLSPEVHMFPGLQPRLPGAHPIQFFFGFLQICPNLVKLSPEVHMFPGLQPRLPGAHPVGCFFGLLQIWTKFSEVITRSTYVPRPATSTSRCTSNPIFFGNLGTFANCPKFSDFIFRRRGGGGTIAFFKFRIEDDLFGRGVMGLKNRRRE